jgi:hypothetical protein
VSPVKHVHLSDVNKTTQFEKYRARSKFSLVTHLAHSKHRPAFTHTHKYNTKQTVIQIQWYMITKQIYKQRTCIMNSVHFCWAQVKVQGVQGRYMYHKIFDPPRWLSIFAHFFQVDGQWVSFTLNWLTHLLHKGIWYFSPQGFPALGKYLTPHFMERRIFTPCTIQQQNKCKVVILNMYTQP